MEEVPRRDSDHSAVSPGSSAPECGHRMNSPCPGARLRFDYVLFPIPDPKMSLSCRSAALNTVRCLICEGCL